MIDPGFLLHRLGELIADLRSWHYRVADLVCETQATERYTREILGRTDHQLRYIQEQITADLRQCKELQSCVEDLEKRCVSARSDAQSLERSARQAANDSHSLGERCENEIRKSEAMFRDACEKEQDARIHKRNCQIAVERCKRVLDETQTALLSAERALRQALEALRRASSQKTGSAQNINLARYEAAVAIAEVRVAACRAEYEAAANLMEMSEEDLCRAREALNVCVAKRTSAEHQLSLCKQSSLCASQAVQYSEEALVIVALVLKQVEDFSLQVETAMNGCREFTDIANACRERVQKQLYQLQESWEVFDGASCQIQKVINLSETGMNCCQQAIVDLSARCLSLSRFEDTSVSNWRR